MPDFDLHQWFADEELEPCSACGERAGLSTPEPGVFICFACGLVRTREGETTVGELQGRKSQQR
jgi:hypothetical protein